MKGILFKLDMINAIREGKKTQTRRLSGLKKINEEPDKWKLYPAQSAKSEFFTFFSGNNYSEDNKSLVFIKPRYHKDEVVYIKETWAVDKKYDNLKISEIPEIGRVVNLVYKDQHPPFNTSGSGKWRSPLFMPAWAARDFVKILDVRAQRLNQISSNDCRAEGSYMATDKDDEVGFVNLWNSINPKYTWESNPFVFAYTLKYVTPEVREK